MNKGQVMAMMKCDITPDFNIKNDNIGASYNAADKSSYSPTGDNKDFSAAHLTGWGYFQNYYYPQIIRESYPVYIQEKALDKGKQAFEVLKILQDKKLLNIKKVSDFIEAMDSLIKVL